MKVFGWIAAFIVSVLTGWQLAQLIKAERSYRRTMRWLREREARCNFWFHEAQRVARALDAAEKGFNLAEVERLRAAWKEIKLRWEREIREFQNLT